MTLLAPSEHDEQSALISWADWQCQRKYRELSTHLFAVPNGARTSMSVAKRLKREGMRSGVPDLFLAVARGGYHGLFLEMKSRKGVVSKEQKTWIGRLAAAGYFVVVCRGFEEARAQLIKYMEMPA